MIIMPSNNTGFDAGRLFGMFPALKAFGVPLAFVAQDGMTPEDIPQDAGVVFIGGSTSCKLRTAAIEANA